MPSVIPPTNWSQLVALNMPYMKREEIRTPFVKHLYFWYTKIVPKKIIYRQIKFRIGKSQVKLLKNDFPYNRILQKLPNVRHYCLWSKIGPLDATRVDGEISRKFPGAKYFWYENINKNKTLPELWHVHVFVNLDFPRDNGHK